MTGIETGVVTVEVEEETTGRESLPAEEVLKEDAIKNVKKEPKL